jgi:hypothetical protein
MRKGEMKATYSRLSDRDGFIEGLVITGETEFEREWLRVHNFDRFYSGGVVVGEKK